VFGARCSPFARYGERFKWFQSDDNRKKKCITAKLEKYRSYFRPHFPFSMQTRYGVDMFAKANFSSQAKEEALKTAKSSAAAANKYAIFLLSCLSGCQSLPVPRFGIRFLFACRIRVKETKQKSLTKRWSHINAIWCLCTFLHIFLLIEFQFDCSFQLFFLTQPGLLMGSPNSWMVNSSVCWFSFGSFWCQQCFEYVQKYLARVFSDGMGLLMDCLSRSGPELGKGKLFFGWI